MTDPGDTGIKLPFIIGLSGGPVTLKLSKFLCRVLDIPALSLEKPIKQAASALYGIRSDEWPSFGEAEEISDPYWGKLPARSIMSSIYNAIPRDTLLHRATQQLYLAANYKAVVVRDVIASAEANWVRQHGILIHVVDVDPLIYTQKSDFLIEENKDFHRMLDSLFYILVNNSPCTELLNKADYLEADFD